MISTDVLSNCPSWFPPFDKVQAKEAEVAKYGVFYGDNTEACSLGLTLGDELAFQIVIIKQLVF